MNIVEKNNYDDIMNEMCAGIITYYNLDLLNHSFDIKVEVLENSVKKKFEVSFSTIILFQLKHEHEPYQWEYLELTDIDLVYKDEVYTVNIDFWSMANLKLKCKYIEIKK